jgi:hypothetical protein
MAQSVHRGFTPPQHAVSSASVSDPSTHAGVMTPQSCPDTTNIRANPPSLRMFRAYFEEDQTRFNMCRSRSSSGANACGARTVAISSLEGAERSREPYHGRQSRLLYYSLYHKRILNEYSRIFDTAKNSIRIRIRCQSKI